MVAASAAAGCFPVSGGARHGRRSSPALDQADPSG